MKSFKLEMNYDDSLERLLIHMHKWIFESRRKKERKKAHTHIKDCMWTFKLYIYFQNKKKGRFLTWQKRFLSIYHWRHRLHLSWFFTHPIFLYYYCYYYYSFWDDCFEVTLFIKWHKSAHDMYQDWRSFTYMSTNIEKLMLVHILLL